MKIYPLYRTPQYKRVDPEVFDATGSGVISYVFHIFKRKGDFQIPLNISFNEAVALLEEYGQRNAIDVSELKKTLRISFDGAAGESSHLNPLPETSTIAKGWANVRCENGERTGLKIQTINLKTEKRAKLYSADSMGADNYSVSSLLQKKPKTIPRSALPSPIFYLTEALIRGPNSNSDLKISLLDLPRPSAEEIRPPKANSNIEPFIADKLGGSQDFESAHRKANAEYLALDGNLPPHFTRTLFKTFDVYAL